MVPVPGGVFEERFDALRKAGAGAMGTVFRARDRRGGGFVAVKILRGQKANDVDRFAREAAILSTLGHAGIVRYIGHGITSAGEHYLAMEWLDGEDLAARLARRGLTGTEVMALAQRTADALAFAHARGLVHRDLKPSNLFLVERDVERLKIVDFGIARRDREGERLTSTGTLLGTPGYIAPEQIQGDPAHDPRADVFALGCVLFECLTGHPAFQGSNVMAVLAKILLQEVPRTRDVRPAVPEALDDLVARMMARDPSARPPDGEAVLAELARMDALDVVAGLGSPSAHPPPALAGPPSLTLTEHRLVTIVLAGDPEADESLLRVAESSFRVLRGTIEPIGGRAHMLAGGAILVTQWGAGSAVDRAERAARCALAIKARFPSLPVTVITGRGEVSTQVVDGDLVERAVAMLGPSRSGSVHLDDATAGLVGARLPLEREGARTVIRPAPVAAEGTPKLLGRVTPCVGRKRELSMLEGIFSGCVSEPAASAALVLGEAGLGKTRLRRELVDALRGRGERVEVLVGARDSTGAGAPFGLVADALLRAAAIAEGDSPATRCAKLSARIGRHLDADTAPRIAAFLGEMAGVPFPSAADRALRAARDSARLMGDRMRAAWEDWIAAECAARPVLIVLDDLQWGDAATVRLVDSTLRNLRDLPLMVLALGRPTVEDRFPGLWSERHVQLVRLGPVSRRAAEQLVRAGLGDGADADVVARIVARADNNPFYIEELVRAVAAGRDFALPDSVLGTVEARLDAEDAEAKRVLRAASVLGRRFTKGGVAALLAGRSAAEIGACLDALEARELVARASAPDPLGDPTYLFCNGLVREAAYATLTDADRALGHLLAGEWLERAASADPMTLAEHFRRGADPTRAARWYRAAASLALEADDLAGADERAALGVACGAAGEELGRLRLVQAEADVWRGQLASAEARSDEAAALLEKGSATWFRAVGLGAVAASKLGGHERVETRMALAAGTPPARGAASAQLVCLCDCAQNLLLGGRCPAADDMIARLARIAPDPAALEPPVAAALSQLAAFRALVGGDAGAALERLEAALTALESAGDRRNACTVRTSLGVTFAQLGDFESAIESLSATVDEAERLGLADLAAVATQHLGLALAHHHRLADAERCEATAIEAFRALGDRRMEGAARMYHAMIALLAGAPDRAEREAAAAVEQLAEAPPLAAPALAVRARALVRLGRADDALPLAREAMAILDRLGALDESEALVRLVYAEALMASGDREAASNAALAARERLLQRARRIGDTAWRERFLAAVPDHARTLSLAR